MSSSFYCCFVTFSEDGVHDHLYVCKHPCAPGRALLAAMRCSHLHSLSRLQAHKTLVSALVAGMPTRPAFTYNRARLLRATFSGTTEFSFVRSLRTPVVHLQSLCSSFATTSFRLTLTTRHRCVAIASLPSISELLR